MHCTCFFNQNVIVLPEEITVGYPRPVWGQEGHHALHQRANLPLGALVHLSAGGVVDRLRHRGRRRHRAVADAGETVRRAVDLLTAGRSTRSGKAPAKTGGGSGKNQLFCKGAPESVLERCTFARLADGSTVPLTDTARAALPPEIGRKER